MARIEMRVSDLTREPIQDDSQAVRLIVEHPDFPEPIGLDVRPEELAGLLTEERTRFAVLTVDDPVNPNPRRYAVNLDEFESLFRAGDSHTALEEAFTTHQQEQRGRGRRRDGGGRRQGTQRRSRIDYASPEHAGEDHPGRISMAERAYVRDHLDEVNERLRQKGMREIDPTDPEMAERYGLMSV